MKTKTHSIHFFNLFEQMPMAGLLLTYVAYPLALMFEFLSFGSMSPGNGATFSLTAMIFFGLVFSTGGILTFMNERIFSQRQKALVFFAVTIVPSLALHSTKFVWWMLNMKM